MQPSSSIALIVSIIVIKTMVLSSVFGGNFHHADGHPKQFWLKHFGAQAFILTDSIMGDVLLQRRKHVQTLRSAAKKCGVPLVRDDVGRESVRAFAAAIQASQGAEDEKARAKKALAAYEASWPAEAARPSDQAEASGGGVYRLRGKSFLLTYNWDFLNKALPDGTPPPASPCAL